MNNFIILIHIIIIFADFPQSFPATCRYNTKLFRAKNSAKTIKRDGNIKSCKNYGSIKTDLAALFNLLTDPFNFREK
jgi:hypothetical protein